MRGMAVFWIPIAIAYASFGVVHARAADPLRYSRDIRPILSEKCFHCHGQDKSQRKAGLRLDSFEGATANRDGTPALVPGDATKSDLVARIFSTDADEMMPPPDAHRQLSLEQKLKLKQWINEGAAYAPHWAFAPARPQPLPKVKQSSWVRRPVDAFVLDQLETESLSPSAEASPQIWLRRVSLDLVGLPPTLEEIDRFVADVGRKGESAYQDAVSRLLGSPRFGERMAQDWLDVARYGDTHGFNNDSARSMWRWRDWVIEAFNNGLPYDQFIVEQLAGDLLPAPTLDQKLATGFARNHVINSEGGIIDEEYRVEYVVDRVRTLGLAWMGLTVECSRCHDHKYDPIAQRDFYRLFAFFNNVSETGEDGRVANAAPFMPAPTHAQRARLKELDIAVAAQTKILSDLGRGHLTTPALGKIPVTDPAAADASLGLTMNRPWTFATWAGAVGPIVSTMDMRPHPSSQAHGRGVEVRITEKGAVEMRLADRWPAYAVQVRSTDLIRMGLKNHVVVVYDGSQKARGVRIFIDGRESPTEVDHDDVTPGTDSTKAPRPPGAGDWRVFDRQLGADEVAAWSQGLLSNWLASAAGTGQSIKRREFLRELAWRRANPAYEIAFTEREHLRHARLDLERRLPTAMVMVENAPRQTHLLIRGQYDVPGEALTPGVPESLLGAWPTGAPRNRLGLARWLTKPDHPLTGRVVVNRFWQQLFGTGIVKTVEDFGLQGEFPSHPELLDWLARRFVDGGWNVKELLRDIVLSATYRQESTVRPVLRDRDPDNRLLARGPRGRLPAEMIRDQMLASSGLLRHRLGGPGVFPYQPPDLYRGIVVAATYPGTVWENSSGDDLYRRSLYTFWKRTVPHPMMAIFDAPDREVCLARRPNTNTPLQALALMNEPGAVEAARALAERSLRDGGPTDDDKLGFAFRLVTSRRPASAETRALRKSLQRFRRSFAGDSKGARALLSVGALPHDPQLAPVETAAMTSVVGIIFNLNESISKH